LTKYEGSPVAAAQARCSTQFGFFSNSMELEFSAPVYVLPPGAVDEVIYLTTKRADGSP
jgi:hypothetical protein